MKVYRPYDSSESGTYEYGIFSDHGKALAYATRVASAWMKQEFGGDADFEVAHDGMWVRVGQGGDSDWFYIRIYNLDEEIDQMVTGYT